LYKIEREGPLPNALYEATLTQLPKPNKVMTRRRRKRRNRDTKILNKLLANQI
jgi:hypothetical protein